MSEEWEIASFEKTMDFSLEAQKSLFLLNGAAAVAVLAFWGETQKHSCGDAYFWIPLLLFALGSVLSVLGMFLTREAQIYFGNHHNVAGMYLNTWVTNACFISFAMFFLACTVIIFIIHGIRLFLVCLSVLIVVFMVFNAFYCRILNKAETLKENKSCSK